MEYLKVGDKAKRNDTGWRVRIVEVIPSGTRVFYRVEDCKDGHTTMVGHEQLRPDTKGE